MAHAYTEPATSPGAAAPNPLMPAFLAMALRADEATRRADESDRARAFHAYLWRGDVGPGLKLLYLRLACTLSARPPQPRRAPGGVPESRRPTGPLTDTRGVRS